MLLALTTLKAQTTIVNGRPVGNFYSNQFQNQSDSRGNDSVFLRPTRGNMFVRFNLQDSVTIKYPNGQNSPGDEIKIIFEGPIGNKAKFSKLNFVADPITITQLNRAIISFLYDGQKWIENTRTL